MCINVGIHTVVNLFIYLSDHVCDYSILYLLSQLHILMFAELFPYAKEHIFSHARMDYGAVGCKWR